MKPKISGWMRALAMLIFLAGGLALWSFWTQPASESTDASFLGRLVDFILVGAFTLLMGFVALTGKTGPFSKKVNFKTTEFPAISDQHEVHSPIENILKIRLYSDGRLTLDQREITPNGLSAPFRKAVVNSGAVWMFVEGGDMKSTPLAEDVLREISKVNLPFLFANSEDFSDVATEVVRGTIGPPNLFLYQTKAEFNRHLGNGMDTLIYVEYLVVTFESFFHDRDDSGIFHIVVAMRPNRSKIWLLHPGQYPDEQFAPLVNALEKLPLPYMADGVVAFAVSKRVRMTDNESQDFDVPAPTEWTDIPKRLNKSMSVTEILDVVWPEDSI